MKIHFLMIPDPITIEKDTSIQDAIGVMKANSIRHLPVVTKGNKLEGFITLADLKQGLIPSMVADLRLSDLMIRNPITVSPDDDVEIAAQYIYEYKIGGIPVVDRGRLVGIITESDILRAFIDMMGVMTASSRIDVAVGEEQGAFRNALQIINENGGDVINIGMAGQDIGKRVYFFRLTACKTDGIRKALEKNGFKVISALD
jgi:acetoin utilization protein AcuB